MYMFTLFRVEGTNKKDYDMVFIPKTFSARRSL